MGIEAKYVVRLESEEREYLQSIINEGGRSPAVLKRVRVLLKADEDWTDPQISDFAGVSLSTVYRVRQRCVEEGLESAIFRKQSDSRLYRKLDGEGEAQLIALACSEAPEGRSRWTLHLLADRLVSLEVTDSISHECVRATLKKTSSSLT